jgi:AcrR family transcriptional regulator
MSRSTTQTPNFTLLLEITEQTIRELGCNKTTLQEIMNRSGLSKGAIYHYVKSKDELFALVLQAKMQEINEKFNEAVEKATNPEIDVPLQAITENLLPQIVDETHISNIIFFYLLAHKDTPRIKEILADMHNYSIQLSTKWIEIGQQHGVIPKELDARKTAAQFFTYVYGLRVQRMISPNAAPPVTKEQLFSLFYHTLKGHSN